MDTNAMKSKIKWKLLKVSQRNLKEISDFIEFILNKEKKEKEVVSLKGIWRDIGFEKFSNLERTIKDLREESSNHLLKRSKRWNT